LRQVPFKPFGMVSEFGDPLTDVLRAGARRLLAQAVELEAEAFLGLSQTLAPAAEEPERA